MATCQLCHERIAINPINDPVACGVCSQSRNHEYEALTAAQKRAALLEALRADLAHAQSVPSMGLRGGDSLSGADRGQADCCLLAAISVADLRQAYAEWVRTQPYGYRDQDTFMRNVFSSSKSALVRHLKKHLGYNGSIKGLLQVRSTDAEPGTISGTI